jgi:H+/Cl- antiporter ClcA
VPIGSYALIGGGALLAAAMQGPLAACVLMLELTHSNGALTVPLLLAVGEATVVARLLRAPSIYSARLAGPTQPAQPPQTPAGATAAGDAAPI